jgi:6-phosphogluconolactonase
MDKKIISVFKNEKEAAYYTACKWWDIAAEAIEEKGAFNAALSGGSTPRLFFQELALSADSQVWKKTRIFLVDERFVRPDDPKSNYFILEQALLSRTGIPRENIYPVTFDGDSTQAAALKYEKALKKYFCLKTGEFPRFDLIMLGLGEDGHTASLFPGTPAVDEKKALVASVKYINARCERVTMTLPVINSARHVIYFVTGERKAQVAGRLLQGEGQEFPASLVNPYGGTLYFYMDEKAGALTGH